jgi:dipeptidyl aminopeptidase/acylaminoacyl peptidase
MRIAVAGTVVCLMLVGIVGVLQAQDGTDVKAMVRELGSDKVEDREAAQVRIKEHCAGLIVRYRSASKVRNIKEAAALMDSIEEVADLLGEAAKGTDPDVARRAAQIRGNFSRIGALRIAFAGVGQGKFSSDVWVMDADGSNVVNLTNSPKGDDDFPEWSPDGSTIRFKSYGKLRKPSVWTMDADGNNQKYLEAWQIETDDVNRRMVPAWKWKWINQSSEDGNWKLTNRREDLGLGGEGPFYNTEIYLTNVKTNETARITNNDRDDFGSISPDGTRIAFTTRVDPESRICRLWMIERASANPVEGGEAAWGEPKQISDEPAVDMQSPCWSPDGSKVAFMIWDIRKPDENLGRFRFCVIDATGKNLRRLPGACVQSKNDSGQVIFVVDADCNTLMQLTDSNYPAGYGSPAWSPEPLPEIASLFE